MSFFEQYYENKHEFANMSLTLDRVDNALKECQFNQNKLGRIVHVAGTNGKGSTSYFLAQILEKNGLKTALFTSPHILDIKERFSLSLENITEQDFDRVFKKYENIIKKYELTFFESTFFIAALWFSENQPEVTILETGLGGRLDATNTKAINEKICAITSIAMDHSQILGDNVFKIADEKIKIARENSIIFLGVNKECIKNYIKKSLKNQIIEIKTSVFAENHYFYPFSQNYSSAIAIANHILGKNLSDYAGLELPQCRLERIGNIILDGSHNPAGVLALTKSGYAANANAIIFSSTKDRNPAVILNILKKISDNIIFTTVPENDRMVQEKPYGLGCRIILDPSQALTEALKFGDNILVTGSFFLSAYIKKKLRAESL